MENQSCPYAGAAATFLKNTLPKRTEGWDHGYTTAYQIGCEALAALGVAEETLWGAVPRDEPRIPDRLPRWDDTCIAVTWVAEQAGKIRYLPANSVESNIKPILEMGSAWADSDTMACLVEICLVKDRQWTGQAELVFWRLQAQEWDLNIGLDRRLQDSFHKAHATMPQKVKDQLQSYLTSADDQALNDLRWMFYRNWRLGDGWLTPDQATRALEVFNDPLADQMCHM